MARVLQITDGTNTIDLTNSTDMEWLPGWTPQVTDIPGDGRIPPYVVEEIPVKVYAATHDALASSMQKFHTLQREAAEYWVDQQQTTAVWFHQQLETETGQRRALVKSLRYVPTDPVADWTTEAPSSITRTGTLYVERHPYWERTIYRVMPTSASAAGLSRAYNYTAASAQMLSNIGFETAGAGGADIFANWVESAGDGAIADEGAIVHAGSHACKLTSGATSNTEVSQSGTTNEYQIYYISFYTRGDGTHAGRYAVHDDIGGVYIIPVTSTGVTGTDYTLVGATFTAPAGCAVATLILYCPSTDTGIAYFDDAGMWLQGHDVVGDVGARIDRLNFTAAAGDVLGRAWIGLRSAARYGTLANFERYWECEDATVLGTDAALAADATANPGGGGNTKVTVTPGTASLASRLTIYLSDITANESDNFGLFLWLLRAKVSAGEWQVHLRYGYAGMDAADYVQGQVITLSNTSWDLFEMDTEPIPLRNLHALTLDDLDDSHEAYYAIQIWGERTSGSGTLDLDCLCPIPVDEGWAKVGTFQVSANTVIVGSTPYDVYIGYEKTVADGSWREFGSIDAPGFYLPPGDGRMIIVIARETTSDITDQISIGTVTNWGRYYERWASLRGAE